jgi:hypothetical protein
MRRGTGTLGRLGDKKISILAEVGSAPSMVSEALVRPPVAWFQSVSSYRDGELPMGVDCVDDRL